MKFNSKLLNILPLTVILFYAMLYSVSAQPSGPGTWLIYFGNQSLSKKWNWHNEVQYRSYDFKGDLQQLLLRTGLGYNLSESNNNLLAGYGFIRTENYIPGTENKTGVDEHRIFQQFITRQQFGRVFLQHRYRVEERIFKDDFRMRFRYFLAVNIPLNRNTMSARTLYLSGYNEAFLNAESPIFDRNRLYGALGYVINKNVKLEVGFMNQSQENVSVNQFQIVLFNNLPFYKD